MRPSLIERRYGVPMNKTSLLAGVGAFLLTCGPTANYSSSHGIDYFWSPSSWNTEQIERQESWYLAGLEDAGWSTAKVRGSVAQAQVYVYDGPLACLADGGLCNGYEDYNRLHVRDMGCPYRSGLTHELTHWLQLDIYKINDYDHVDTPLWILADGSPEGCP